MDLHFRLRPAPPIAINVTAAVQIHPNRRIILIPSGNLRADGDRSFPEPGTLSAVLPAPASRLPAPVACCLLGTTHDSPPPPAPRPFDPRSAGRARPPHHPHADRPPPLILRHHRHRPRPLLNCLIPHPKIHSNPPKIPLTRLANMDRMGADGSAPDIPRRPALTHLPAHSLVRRSRPAPASRSTHNDGLRRSAHGAPPPPTAPAVAKGRFS